MYLINKYKSIITFSFATIMLFQPLMPILNLKVQAEEAPVSMPLVEEITELLPSVIVGGITVSTDYSPYVLGTSFQIAAPVTTANIDTATLSCYVTKHFNAVTPEYSNWIPATFNGTTCTSPILQEDNTVIMNLNVRVTNGSNVSAYGVPVVRQSDVDSPFITAFNLTPINAWVIPSSVTLVIAAADTVSPVIACEGRYNHNGIWSNWILGTMVTVGKIAECKVNVSGLVDGHEYDFQARVLDTVGHWYEGWLLENLIVDGLVTEPEIDKTRPHVHTLLSDQSFNEGSVIPDIFITGVDDTDVDELCFNIKTFNGAPALWPMLMFGCKDDNVEGNTSFTWNLKELFHSVGLHHFDPTILVEGNYVFEYYVKDAAGNRSTAMMENTELDLQVLGTNYQVAFNIVNVVPVVQLMNDQNIVLDQDAVFTGSFTDPSCISKDGGCHVGGPLGYPDDASWSTIINYGDGTETNLTGNWNMVPGNITIPNHKYAAEGTYTVTLTVCENQNNVEELVDLEELFNPFSEGMCATDIVTVVVGDSKPTVSISTNPGDSTTLQSITMNAVVVGGNVPYTYSWSGGNFAACTGSATSVVTPAVPGTYTCNLQVMDQDEDVSNIATKTVTVNDVPKVPDLNPNVVLFGNSPSTNVGGAVQVSIGTPFTITANLSNLGNPNYNFTFGGVCTGASNNTANTNLVSDTLNLAVGNYVCTVAVSDADGDVTVASVPVNVGGVLGTQSATPEEDNNDDGDVEGDIVQVCEQKYTVSGTVFTDLDNDSEKDDNEVGTAGVLVQVYLEDGLDEVIVAEETTSANGEYSFELCPGSFNVRISENDVPDNLEILGASDKEADVIDTNIDNLNFILTEAEPAQNGFNWWIFAILLLIIAGGTGIYLYTGRNQE